MSGNLWGRIFYKREFVDKVIKDGEVYKKYRKVPRFKYLPQIALFLLAAFVVVVVALAFLQSSDRRADRQGEPVVTQDPEPAK